MSVEAAFAPFLEPATVRGLLASHLPAILGRVAEVRDVQLLHAWRRTYARPSTAHRNYLIVSYGVEIAASPGGRSDRILLQGRVDADAHCDDVPEIARGAPALPDASWPLRLRMPGARLALRRFPDDPAMPQLAALYATRRAPGQRSLALLPRVVSYRPGERCTMAFEDADGNAHAYAKLFADAALARAVAGRMAGIGRQLGQRATTLRVPPLLQFDPAAGVVWSGALDGAAGADSGGAPDATTLPHRLVTALADLHGLRLDDLAIMPRPQRLTEATRKVRKLGLALPGAIAPAAATLARCAALLAHPVIQGVPASVPRHGDVHPGQFRVGEREVSLFDFDEMALGDPEEDVAALEVSLAVTMPEARTSELAAVYENARSSRPLIGALLEYHRRLQWVDRAYRTYWRSGLAARDAIEAALGRAADGLPMVAGEAP